MVGAHEKSVSPELNCGAARRFQSDANRLSRGTVCCALNNAFAQPSLQLFAQHNDPVARKGKPISSQWQRFPLSSEFDFDTRRGLHRRCGSNSRTWRLLGQLTSIEKDGSLKFLECSWRELTISMLTGNRQPGPASVGPRLRRWLGRERTRQTPASSSSKLVGFAGRSFDSKGSPVVVPNNWNVVTRLEFSEADDRCVAATEDAGFFHTVIVGTAEHSGSVYFSQARICLPGFLPEVIVDHAERDLQRIFIQR